MEWKLYSSKLSKRKRVTPFNPSAEVGIEMKFKHAKYPILIGGTHVPELNAVKVGDAGVTVGASVTLTHMMEAFTALSTTLPRHRTATLRAVVEQLRWFAGPPIRNVAALGGNVCTASPISDLNPIWMASGAVFEVAGKGTGRRTVPASAFFLGYRKVDMAPHEVLVSVFVPFTEEYEYVKEFKQARRRDDDIAIVNAGVRLKMRRSGADWEVEDAAFAFGGVAAKSIMAPRIAAALKGRPLGAETLRLALAAVAEDVAISPDAPGGMVEFRRSLAASFVFKGLLHAAVALEADSPDGAFACPFPEGHRSAVQAYHRPPCRGIQFYDGLELYNNGAAAPLGPQIVGVPHRHMAADMQVTGEAQYADDIAAPPGTLHVAFVASSKPHARITKIDAATAMAMPGVAGIYFAADIPGGNDIGAVIHDEELFASDTVTCVGQPIGVVAADSEAAAREAARAVVVEYEELPAIISIDDAIKAESFMPDWKSNVECGDVEAAFATPGAVVVEGEVRLGGQEHFYLEPNACLVVPGENDEIVSYTSSQVGGFSFSLSIYCR
jgi:xanthine dehydrogenase/oxidase